MHRLAETLPSLAAELQQLLEKAKHQDLANQVPELPIVDRCRCGDDFCATFYTQPKPDGAYGAGHDNVLLDPEAGMIILDVINGRIACVEVLYRNDVRNALRQLLP